MYITIGRFFKTSKCSSWSRQVSPRRSLGLDAWCLPPIPVINEAAARFAESASNLGRQIAKVVGELMIFL